jgi:phosphomannomutase / phosphoglucomutase
MNANTLDPHIFRAYDVRGIYGTQLTEDVMHAIGRGFGSTLREIYNLENPKVVVGRDARTHGPSLEKALIDGLVSTGCAVYTIGQTPTPLNYFTTAHGEFDGGMHITASHNPAQYNGCKMHTRHAHSYAGENLQELLKRIQAENYATGIGSIQEYDAVTPYTNFLAKNIVHSSDRRLRVAIDGGNGVAGPLYSEIIAAANNECIGLYIEPDGTFPNHPADPSKRATLQELCSTVQKEGADIGLAFDGDGDRVGIVDEQGTIRTADEVLLLLAQDHIQRGAGTTVVCTVSNSSSIVTEVDSWGGTAHMCKVGHSNVEHAMEEHHALVGGEQSGHFFCAENYYGFDDAIVASLHILNMLKRSGKKLSELCHTFPAVYPIQEVRPHCEDSVKTSIIRKITEHFSTKYPVNTLDGARVDFGNGAWAGIRQSNTSPCLSICIEARSPEHLAAVRAEVLDHVALYPEVDMNKLH